MTKQEIFDKVVNHLLTQNKRAIDYHFEYQKCMYRTKGGLKCAIGCLIPDEAYDSRFEYMYLTDVVASFPWMEPHLSLLHSLQMIHDQWSVDAWEDGLRQIAEEYGLEWNYAGI